MATILKTLSFLQTPKGGLSLDTQRPLLCFSSFKQRPQQQIKLTHLFNSNNSSFWVPKFVPLAAVQGETTETNQTQTQESSSNEAPIAEDEVPIQESDDSENANAEEEPLSPIVASLLSYKEALLSNDEVKIAEIEAFLLAIEEEKNSLANKVVSLSEELSPVKDRALRISADFDNFRKRTERERLSLVTNVQGEVVESLLPVLDNFDRARTQIKVETEGEEKINNSYQSISKQFIEILESLGVVPVDTVGSPFDPLVHEAIMREDSTEFEEGVVLQEFRKGFKLGERLLRPSMVKVSAGPGPAKPTEDVLLEVEVEGVGETSEESIIEGGSLKSLSSDQHSCIFLPSVLAIATKALMNDAEQKQVRNEAVKAWLKELKDIAYDTEDVLDEWGTKFYGTNMDDHAVWKNKHLTSLRILDLSRARFEELPNEVGNLILLRYLDLSHTSLQKLPETVSNLRNLQTLILYGCLLRELPKGLGKLVNLRHLENECTFKLERLPPGIGRLTHLQTLSKFIVSEECKISYLKDLNKLKGSLEIINIKGETQEAGAAELKSKEHLRVLKLRFSDASFNDCHDQVHRVLDLLEPHPNLEELEIYSYNGSKFPSWMEFRAKESPYIMLRRLTISHCEQWKVLPPLVRLESLEYLSLSGLDPVALMGLDGAVRDGGGAGTLVFPKLRKLLMSDMENWEEWVMRTTEGITIMPCLQTLEIMNCPMLKSLPHQILSDSLRELSITDCPVLRITCIPNFLETLNLYGDSGSLSRSLPFIANHNLLLNSLYIDNSPHLTLPQGLAQLTELTTIHISHSKSLVCMSEELKQLTLLELLYIEDCPILASRCKKEVGEDWPIISHIPVIQIDDNMIHGGQLIFTTAVPGFTVSKIFSNADRSLNKQLRDKKEKKRDYWEEVVSETLPATVGEEDSSSC
ncbi:hypothetical protein GIB67_021816 [Kingdonia uniflora]|uniref:GrpE protein homolog n=1 Tax=Kingdonia uniflora TaxID=39325 RepID=A0A7J7P799_9MAGN|nr:hypothetical protein GIB67_021816 [Kingdonia uniflora]